MSCGPPCRLGWPQKERPRQKIEQSLHSGYSAVLPLASPRSLRLRSVCYSAPASRTGELREIVEPCGIVDQDAPPRRLVRGPLLEQLQQAPGIGHLAFDPR